MKEPKTALVTGANRGIGFELTKRLLEKGMVVFAVARHMEPLKKLKTIYLKRLHIIPADLSNLKGQMAVSSAITSSLDYIIHNAAIVTPLGGDAFLKASPEDLVNIMQVNAMAPMIITNKLMKFIKKGTRSLFISSRAGNNMYPGIGPYCVSNHFVDAYVQSLRLDHSNLLIATVHPGEVNTGMQEDLRKPDIKDFPLVTTFHKTYKDDKLLSPEIAARFLEWVLIGTTDAEFKAKKHNIYDDQDTYKSWLPEGYRIINPYPTS